MSSLLYIRGCVWVRVVAFSVLDELECLGELRFRIKGSRKSGRLDRTRQDNKGQDRTRQAGKVLSIDLNSEDGPYN